MFTQLFPMLATRDMARAFGFYRDLLDGTVTYEFPEPDGTPAYASLEVGGSTIGIGLDATVADVPRPKPISIWLYATDCDEAVERLRAAGRPAVGRGGREGPGSGRQRGHLSAQRRDRKHESRPGEAASDLVCVVAGDGFEPPTFGL